MQYLFTPLAQKLFILALYGFVGYAVQAGYLPPSTKAWLAENLFEVLFLAFGLGHVLPEAAQK